jgi:poly(3-hydroxybutyrate) depolymerase
MSRTRSPLCLTAMLAATALLAGLVGACGDDDVNANNNQNSVQQDAAIQYDAAAQQDAEVQQDSGTPPDGCETLQAGTNSLMVDGLQRQFILALPSDVDTGGPFPVVFNYHGLGDTSTNMHGLFSGQVNTTDFHFILITPEDTDYMVMGMMNIDWDVMAVPVIDDNIEVKLFDAVLACLESRWGVDENHIHAAGFSMGGFLTDLIGVTRGDLIASLMTYSGGYGSNSTNTTAFGTLASQVNWPTPAHSRLYPQLLAHGGIYDSYNATVATLQFDTFAANDVTYLNGMGHDTIICNHDIGQYSAAGQGHTVPFGVSHLEPSDVVTFFKDHPKTVVDSPYSSALPTGWPSYCSFASGN